MKYKEEFVLHLVEFYKRQLESVRGLQLSQNEPEITHQHILSYATYSPWTDDEEFINVMEVISGNTLVDIYRCYELWNFIKRNRHLKGDILEVGVWRGGTGCLMAKASELYSSGKIFLADTFSGVVKASDRDTAYRGGEHSDTSIDIVKDLINGLKLQNVEILVGIFPDQVSLNENSGIADIKLCHIDVDTYSSGKDIFHYICNLI